MNVDIKAFSESFYKKICGAQLKPVIETCENAKKLGIHLEVTYLVIPRHNDSIDEIRRFCSWVVEKLGEDTPVHFSRFHPEYKMTNVPMTPMETLLRVYDVAKEVGILYAYLGNVSHGDYENTMCPRCSNLCIKREGYSIDIVGAREGKCVKCGNNIPLVADKYNK